MRNVIVIARERLTRAYIGGQLQEEGFAVTGSPDVLSAVDHLRQQGITPDVALIDVSGESFSQEAIDILSGLCPGAPLLIIHGTWDFPASIKWPGEVYRLARPVTVGQIVDKVKDTEGKSRENGE